MNEAPWSPRACLAVIVTASLVGWLAIWLVVAEIFS
jgi:hypothetical protein